MQAISKYKAVISTAPNFAYGLCLNKVKDKEMEGLDLSSWWLALNGAEPIDVDTMKRFTERFAQWGFRKTAIVPVYGLAEAGLGVTFPELQQEPVVTEFDRDMLSTEGRAVRGTGRKLPSVGKPLPGLEIEIRDPDGNALPEGYAGRIFISGPSITSGYFNDPEMTADIIGPDGWLNTGDLGFFFEGNLYIGGRAKDLIILRGRNYAPQEFEDPIYELDGLRLGCAVAVSTTVEGQGEQLIILAEKDSRSDRPDADIAADVKTRMLGAVSVEPWHVEILEAGTLPRTSSGKMRRSEALRQFLAGELTPPEKVTTLKILKEVAKSQLAWARFSLTKK
jgi:acyl-CoA synthetase (AMP-forming)/AMP-acid ligase II